MAQYRKSVFDLGSGPGLAVPDPRVQEAQGWLQLGSGFAAQQAARDAQIATGQAALRRAAIEAAAKDREFDLRKQLAQLDADTRLQEALMREEGWTGREERREAGETQRAQGKAASEWQRALLQAGLEEEKAAAMAQRDADRAGRDDRWKALNALLTLQGRQPEWKDQIERGAWEQRQRESLPEDPEEGLAALQAMDPTDPRVGPMRSALARQWQAAPPRASGPMWQMAGAAGRSLPGLGGAVRAGESALGAAAPYLETIRSGLEMFQGEPLPLPPELQMAPQPDPREAMTEALLREILPELMGQ